MIEVSDHAVLRYLERVEGYDIDTLRSELAKSIPESAVRFSKGSLFKYKADCCMFVIKDCKVLTVVNNGSPIA